ncbi:MAG TPA: sulfatase-like hydrolase/transferase [Thermoanaerobaculia bacterium]|nr:sulfatase-like hydrolase/transferase [Thermoanaerobaculia bacterium]
MRTVLAALLLILTACARGGDRLDVPKGTPVVLISIDTLRADHLPAYGYRGVETPALDGLRKDGVLFEKAYSPTPLTFPAHSSLLTGVLPAVHGVRDNVGYRLDKAKIEKGELPFLPWLLKQQGYATGGAVSAYVLQGKGGLSTGFDLYEDAIEFRTNTGLGGLQRPGTETLDRARSWLESVKDGPFFLFFHLYEPHTPYEPAEPFASRYASKYDGEIATADRIVGDLLADLKRLGLYDKALIVLVSDHGEGLGDHVEKEHGVLLYDEAIHVPMILKLPDSQLSGSTVEKPAQLTDVAPTVLSLLGMTVPPALKGMPLLDLLQEKAPVRRIYSETFYPRIHFGWSELTSLADGRHHYIESPDPELYDLAADPDERTNVLSRERRLFAEMRKEMSGYDRRLAPPAAVDEESRQAMMALGYIGSGVGDVEGPLPDPKSRIASLGDLKLAFEHSARKEHAQAVEAYRRVLAVNPNMSDAWEFLGHALQALGRTGEALEAYREGLRVSHGSPTIAVAAASLYFDLGQLDEAASHARMALTSHPSFAHGLLAQIALRRKDLDGAEREARLAMNDESLRVGPMITLAEVLHARGRYEEALDLTRRAVEVYNRREAKDPDLIQGLSLIRGKILADMGDATGAEASFLQEIRLFPADYRAYSNLAVLYAVSGRPERVGPTLKQMVEASPTPASYAEAVKTLRALHDPGSAASLLRFALGKYPGSPELLALGRG